MTTTRHKIIGSTSDVTDAIGTVETWLLELVTNVPDDVFAAWFNITTYVRLKQVQERQAQQRKGTE